MWIPAGAEDIERAALAGELEETASFDAKAALPAAKRNADLATDVAAMSTDGRVLLYGVAEDENARPTIPRPIDLAGAGERVDLIVGSSIAEVPYIDVRPLPLADDPSRGYLVVVVPQSARAPHQVIVGGDLRYYGRGATGNRRLQEGEVARLYERRLSWTVEQDTLLAESVASAPLPPHPEIGYVHAFARPVAADDGLWDRDATGSQGDAALHTALLEAAGSSPIMGTFSPALGRGGVNWQRQGADAWRLSTWHHIKYSEVSYHADPTTLAEAIIHITGRGRMFCGRATDFREGDALVMEVIVAGNVGAFLAMMAKLYRTAGYHGQVDVGVAVTNVHGAGSLRMQRGFQTSAYNAPGFTRTARFAVAELGDHERRTLDLLGRVFAASTGLDGYDPFEERR